ncbi:PfaB family protein [Colwelliaceae bacterium MEBiC 14330]
MTALAYKSAIIGFDAQFENQQGSYADIDQVERALYLGKNAGQTSIKTHKATLELDCLAAIARMAQANKVAVADIKVIVLAQDALTQAAQALAIENALIVSSLAMAFQQLDELISHNELVAVLGVNLTQHFTANSVNVSRVEPNSSLDNLATISVDESFQGYQSCRGLAAMLFSSVRFARQNNSYVYAWLKGVAIGADIGHVALSALEDAQVKADDIGLMEVSALAGDGFKETNALFAPYTHQQKLVTAISCARSITGEGEGFSQVFGLLRCVIALQQRYIPGINDWQKPFDHSLSHWDASSFYFPTQARPWYPNPQGDVHLAAYSCLALNDEYCHAILAENKVMATKDEKHPTTDIRDNGFIASSELKMILVTGDTQQTIQDSLNALEQLLSDDKKYKQASLKDIAQQYFEKSQQTRAEYSLVLLCESTEELLKEIVLAREGVAIAFSQQSESQNEWRTPKGSYFTAKPINKLNVNQSLSNNVCFLYPGIGATYLGLGRDLLHLFPEIHQDVANLADDIGASLKDCLLNPRTIVRPSFEQLKLLDLKLRASLADIAEAGVGFACVFTKIFEEVFKLKADFAAGYSMGEVSMYAALGAWQQPGLMSARLANSSTFNERLCGDLLTLREHWHLPELAEKMPEQADEVIWETYNLKATLDEVSAVIASEKRVYCTIINSPDSLLIAGYPADCLRVIKKLGRRAMPLKMANAIHSPPAKTEYDNMVQLYTMDVSSRLQTKMYSSSCYLPIPQLSKAIAHSVAQCLCEPVDFPRLINTMHDQGAQIFIEMGAGRSLSGWVDKILAHSSEKNIKPNEAPSAKASLTVPVNAKGTSDELTYFRAIAKLISHGVKLDLNRLYSGSIIVQKA